MKLQNIKLSPKLIDLIAFLSGCMLVFAFSPFYLSPLAFISIAFLFLSWIKANPKRAAWRGFLYGMGSFGVGVSWVFISINTYGNTNIFVGGFITFAFIFALSLFPALAGFLSTRFFKEDLALRTAVIFPSVWVLIELLRGWAFTGFPWLLLGYTQTNTFIGGLAAIGGVYLVSLVTAFLSALVIVFIRYPSTKYRLLTIILATIILLCALLVYKKEWTQPLEEGAVGVTLVQGNVPQLLKWDPNEAQKILDTYYTLTQNNMSTLVFWPENAIPMFAQQIGPYMQAVEQLADRHHSAILIGMPYMDNNTKAYYNSATVLGYGHGQYLKHHLVPFGEYLPLQSLIGPVLQFMDIPMSNFSAGPLHQHLLNMDKIRVALSICYESAFPNQIREQSKHANLMAIISDDAWFGNSFGPWQHLQIAQMRAIENGRYVVQSTNDGITAIINDHGEVVKQIPQFKTMVLKGYVLFFEGSTPWQRYGVSPIIMLLFLMIFIAVLYKRPFTIQRKKH